MPKITALPLTTLTTDAILPVVQDGVTSRTTLEDITNVLPFLQSGTGAVERTILNKLLEFPISVKDYGAVGDGVANDTTAIQSAFTYAAANRRAIFIPAGTYRVTSQLTYTLPATSNDYRPGITLVGAGMGKSVFVNEVSGAAMIYIISTSPDFAKGNHFADFTITRGASATTQIGIRSKGAWYTSFDRVRIRTLAGTAVLVGDSTVSNPDTTANAAMTFTNCEFDENEIGIYNPVNNNAPGIRIFQTSIRNNSKGGVFANSSHLVLDGCSLAFNGLTDTANAFGGIVVNEVFGSTASVGYRSKDVWIKSCEIDTNYPYQIDIRTAEMPVIENNSMKWEDYTGTAAASLLAWPDAQIRIGGSVVAERVLGGIIRDNRVGVVNNGHIAAGMGGHALLHVGSYAQHIKWYDQVYDMSLGGGVMGTDAFIIKEDSKAGTVPDLSAPRFHVEYDFPINGGSNLYVSTQQAYNVPYPIVFPAVHANTQYQFTLADDTAKALTSPTVTGENGTGTDYGFIVVTAAGAATRSDIFVYRAATSPACTKIGTASTALNASTGILAGTTGTDTFITVSAHTDGKIYIENRAGSALTFNVAFLNTPGVTAQV